MEICFIVNNLIIYDFLSSSPTTECYLRSRNAIHENALNLRGLSIIIYIEIFLL